MAYLDGASDEKENINPILKMSYQAIGQNDAAFAFLDALHDEIEYYREKRMSNQLYLCLDVMASTGSTEACSLYADYLFKDQFHYFSREIAKKTENINYDCQLRLGDWSLIDTTNATTENCENDFSKDFYFAIKNLRDRNELNVMNKIDLARKNIIKKFRLSNYECVKNIYENLMNLNQLQQLEDFCSVSSIEEIFFR